MVELEKEGRNALIFSFLEQAFKHFVSMSETDLDPLQSLVHGINTYLLSEIIFKILFSSKCFQWFFFFN